MMIALWCFKFYVIKGQLKISPDLVFLSSHDYFVSSDGAAIFAPADLGGRVSLDLHSQHHIILQLGRDVFLVSRLHVNKASL